MKGYRHLFLNNRLFTASGLLSFLFILCFILKINTLVPKILFFTFVAFIITDLILLFRARRGVSGERQTPDRLSNGDDNGIGILVQNHYTFKISIRLFDEIPHQFQRRDLEFNFHLLPGQQHLINYKLKPVIRGEYSFGVVNALVSTPLRLAARRFQWGQPKLVPVYPSFLQMRKYELLAIHNRLTEVGVKKIRKIGHNQEFEMIREYVGGDDIRTLNWKATARRSRLMVNQYQDERSQQVYCLIDKGRVMQMPFQEMSLLDYAINASLVISNIAIKKYDKAGLITFSDRIGNMVPASRKNNQIGLILEVLYHQKTTFPESDFSRLHLHIRNKLTQRSLLLLFTNFESLYAMERQLPYLKNLAQRHVLVVVFFENTELKALLDHPAKDIRSVYHKAIAEKFSYEKKMIVGELNRHGIHTILTAPENLTVQTINKYLELKARNLI